MVRGLTLVQLPDQRYGFSGKLHEAVLAVLKRDEKQMIREIDADDETGIQISCFIGKNRNRFAQNALSHETEIPLSDEKERQKSAAIKMGAQTQTPSADTPSMMENELLLTINDQFDPRQTMGPSPVVIQLGFDRYEEKFKKIRHIVNFMQKNNPNKRIRSIDLINPENIVVKLDHHG